MWIAMRLSGPACSLNADHRPPGGGMAMPSQPWAAPHIISAIAAQLLSLSATTGWPSLSPDTSPMLTPAHVGTMLARPERVTLGIDMARACLFDPTTRRLL
jgi:hypothetical protein